MSSNSLTPSSLLHVRFQMSLEGLLFVSILCHTLFLCFIHVLSIYSLLGLIAVHIGFSADLMSVILSFLFVFSNPYGVDSFRGRLPFQKKTSIQNTLQRTDPIVVSEGALTGSSGTLSQDAKKGLRKYDIIQLFVLSSFYSLLSIPLIFLIYTHLSRI